MKTVILDSKNAKVIYLDVEDEMVNDDSVYPFLKEHGYGDPDIYSWMAVPEVEYVPIEYHRHAIHKGDGKKVHQTCNERLRFGTPYDREKDLKKREQEECLAALKAYSEKNGGKKVRDFDDNEHLVVAGYLYDEPCDIAVKSIGYNETYESLALVGYDKNDPSTEQEISADELFAGQLNEITERI